MGPRPAHLNLANARSNTNDGSDNNDMSGLPPPRFPNFHMDLPSPRTGEVPPALSPLDAFALQSRLLAKKFEDEAQAGRRLSRLPHQDVAKSFAARPDFFRNASGESMGGMSDVPELVEEDSRPVTRSGEGRDRPKSHYPMLGRISRQGGESSRAGTPVGTPFFEAPEQRQRETPAQEPKAAQDYFGAARASSPEPMDTKIVNVEAPSPRVPSLTNSVDSLSSSHPRTWTNSSTRSQKSDRGLLPPKSPGFPKSPRSIQSIRSVRQDSGDDDGASTNGSQAVASSRKFSESSVRSRPQSPFSPFMHPVHRSPSVTSDYSMSGSQAQLPKPSFNFSRPISSHGSKPSLGGTRPSMESKRSFDDRPSVDYVHRPIAASALSNGSFITSTSGARSRQSSQDDAPTPFANAPTPFANVPTPSELEQASDGYFSGATATEPPKTSYTDRSFVLPRGRAPERTSADERHSWMRKQFTWDAAEQPAQRKELKKSDSPTATPSVRAVSPSPSEKLQHIAEQQTDTRDRLGCERAMSSANRSRSADPRALHDPMPKHNHTPSLMSDSTDRTIRAIPLHQRAASAELTAEEHLEIGIQAHSSGALNKSTYHLRLAAKAGLPTAMLLYALACRHGWGMRPNQEDGVMWLRKAIQSSQLDVEASLPSSGKTSDPIAEAAERKKRKAQFALAIYELGISYMNGWGCAKDKPLAVQCYEIAGAWGDCDALAEAGFCYTQGAGCKKDLKRAAALYRKAAEGGMSMTGNSWIYKSKYMVDENASTTPEKMERKERSDSSAAALAAAAAQKDASMGGGSKEREKDAKPAGRSRARSIWGRKKDKEKA